MASIKEYTKEDLTVVWKVERCIHSEICAKGLGEVFNPKNRPWVNIDGATLSRIREQIDKCPSGALSYKGDSKPTESSEVSVQVIENGPLMVTGNLNISTPQAKLKSKQKMTAFCRCGASSNKPFCDGSHKTAEFIG